MTIFLTVIHVLISLFIIGAVLLQAGKGAEVGATFGGGGSTVVTRITTGAAIIFMLTSLALAYFSGHTSGSSIMSNRPQVPTQQEAPVQPMPVNSVPVQK